MLNKKMQHIDYHLVLLNAALNVYVRQFDNKPVEQNGTTELPQGRLEQIHFHWDVDEESVEVCRVFSKLKQSLLPYLQDCAREAHEKGIPIQRAMLLEFPDDPVCPWLDRQYMLGPDILVAPVFNADNEVEYYLPPGNWTHLLDKRRETGGKWLKEKYDFLSLPLWMRGKF
jgi:alpha-glucosidase (family GH31 glycosyl hydrolase)